MRKLFHIALSLLLISSSYLKAEGCDPLVAAVEEGNDMFRTGTCCDDGIYNAISASMFGWGVGLFIGIALLTGLVHQSMAAHATSTSSSSSSSN